MAGIGYLTVEQAKQISLVSFLRAIGHEPAYVRGENHWYRSPLRDEHTPSFKVNNKINLWYDFGEGTGGNIIDLGIRLYNCSVKEFLVRCHDQSFSSVIKPYSSTFSRSEEPEEKIQVLQAGPIASSALKDYIAQRQISLDIASAYCLELVYSYKSKSYFALGFKNDSGGYEIRNKYIKLSSSPKGITTILNGGKAVAVFEGFFDLFSYLQTCEPAQPHRLDYLVLNSTSFIAQCAEIIASYPQKFLFLDNDPNGKKCALFLLQSSNGFTDCSWQYDRFKDVNEWLLKTPPDARLLLPEKAPHPKRGRNKRHQG